MQISDAEIKIILDIIKKHVPNCEVWIFGSRYHGTAKESSDLDLVVIGEYKLSLLQMADLRYAFQESDLLFSVDIIDWNKISKTFQSAISKGHKVIYTPNSLYI